jgi:hypothetical protein
MTVKPGIGSVVASADQTISMSSLVTVTQTAGNPAYLVVSELDRDEYTAGYQTADMGSISGNGVTDDFSNAGGDAYATGIVFTYQASSGQYYNSTYGYLSQMTLTASSNTNDNVSLSFYGTSNYTLATDYASSPYSLEQDTRDFSYAGSVSVVTQPSAAGATPSQATPDSVCAAAQSFVGKAWNTDGCWVLASNISAEAGASLPASSTLAGVQGYANGEWITAYDGPVSANSNWEANITAGEIVGFITTAGGGHITTVVSGSGASAKLIDNITYVDGSGDILNSADDGSESDIVIAAAHPAMQEFSGVNPSDVVVYELNTPIVSDLVSAVSLAAGTAKALTALFTASDPVSGQAITEWQVYDAGSADTLTLNGVSQAAARSAASAITAASLTNIGVLAGSASGSDTLEVRAYNGSYWGDWESLTVTDTGPAAAPAVTNQTANQTWIQGQKVSFTLPANSFTDPQGEALTYTASLASGAKLPSWLSFNAATRTFSGTVPAGMESLTLKVTATDSGGLSAAESFSVTVPAAAPVISSQTASQNWQQGQAVNLVLSAKSFTDPQGEKLTFSASLVGGGALPSWLSFNAATLTFSGMAPASYQNLALQVTATDSSGLSATESFSAKIVAPPTVSDATANQTWTQGQRVSFTLPANSFTDPQGEALTYSASLANGAKLPSWLSFNAATRSFSGTVPSGMENFSLKVTATDSSGLSAAESFSVNVPAAAPVLTNLLPNQTWLRGQTIYLVVPSKTFVDPQSEAMTYSATLGNGAALPSWLSFDAATRTLSGTAPAGVQSLTLSITATDSSGLSSSDVFGASVVAPPTVTGQTANQNWVEGQKVSLTLAANIFTDPQGQKLYYSASLSNGAKLPSWLSFNANTLTFSGTAPASAQSLTVEVTAADSCGLASSETFGVTVSAASTASGHVVASLGMDFISGAGSGAAGFHLGVVNLDAKSLFGQGTNATSSASGSGGSIGSLVPLTHDLSSAIANLAALMHHGSPAFA